MRLAARAPFAGKRSAPAPATTRRRENLRCMQTSGRSIRRVYTNKNGGPEAAVFTLDAAGLVGRRLRLAGFLGLLRDVLAGLLIDGLEAQAHLAAVVDAQHLDLDLVAFLDDVAHL